MAQAVFQQDPHRVRERREKNLETAIGREVKAQRLQQDMTVSELSERTGLSMGMLSKIENGNISPSLKSLEILANTLSVPISSFFRSFEEGREAVHVKSGKGVAATGAGTRAGHQYQLLGHMGANTSGVIVEPYMITLTETSDVFQTFQHEGIELLYMLEGEVMYRHADNIYHLEPGDSLLFDADAPHGPEELTKLPAHFLSIISYPQST